MLRIAALSAKSGLCVVHRPDLLFYDYPAIAALLFYTYANWCLSVSRVCTIQSLPLTREVDSPKAKTEGENNHRAAVAAVSAASACQLVSVSDGLLLFGQKYPKTVKGKPLKTPFYGGAGQVQYFSERHTLEENILRLPRSPAPAYFIVSFLPLLWGACHGAAAYRTPAKQGTSIKRQKSTDKNRRSV